MRKKIHSYLGFAKRSGNLVTGYNTCVHAMKRKKIKLLLLGADISENSAKKVTGEAQRTGTPYRVYSNADELSRITGCEGRGIFGITDENFSNIIAKEIDETQSLEKEVF